MRIIQTVMLAILLLAGGHPGATQVGTPMGNSSGVQNPHVPFGTQDTASTNPMSPAAQEQLNKGRQSERQKKLVADTDRLFALAAELKSEVDKTTKDTMSIQVIKKADEIEKLARSVKERMRG